MKNIILKLFLFYCVFGLGQQKFSGKIKSIKEEVHYVLKKLKPKPKEPCFDCDNDSYYQYGIRIEPELNEHLVIFNDDWNTSPFSNYKNYIVKYNNENQKSEETLFENDNRIRAKIEYKYDDLNQKTSEIIFNRYRGHSIKKYNYSEQGELKSEFETGENYSNLRIYFYDKNKKTRTEYYDYLGFKYQIIHKEIDSLGFKINKNYKVKNNNEDTEYNENDLIQTKLFDKNGDLLYIKNYQFDSKMLINNFCRYYNNNLIEKEIRKSKNRSDNNVEHYYEDVTNYKYDENKRLILNERTFDGKPFQYVTYSYSKNLLSEVTTNAYFDTTYKLNFKYKFDKKGNCIREIKYVNGVKSYIIKRKIKYFN
jgi:hypothetical protein